MSESITLHWIDLSIIISYILMYAWDSDYFKILNHLDSGAWTKEEKSDTKGNLD